MRKTETKTKRGIVTVKYRVKEKENKDEGE